MEILNGSRRWQKSRYFSLFEPQALSETHEEVVRLLRRFVDQWIDSGRDEKTGSEEPHRRRADKIPPGYDRSTTTPLRETLLEWYKRAPPVIAVDSEAGSCSTVVKPPTGDPRGDLRAFVEGTAIYYVHELLNSRDAFRVARCARPECRSYYLRQRLPRTLIKRGTYCGKCSGAGSLARMQATRDSRRQTLVQSAADFWDAFRPSRSHPRRSDWVALKVNRKLRADIERITGKWITQNQKEIEIELGRRKNAESKRA